MERLWAPWRMSYIKKDGSSSSPSINNCIFCTKAGEDDDRANLILYRGQYSYVLLNLFPYTNGHTMIAPYRHTSSLDELEADTLTEIMLLVRKSQHALSAVYRPDGFNIGMNLGSVAGAGIADHVHMHVVPRWNGDSNFMPVVADTRVLPDTLDGSWEKLSKAWCGH